MADAVDAVWGPYEGLVITRYGYARACTGTEIVQAAHPVPDGVGEAATAGMLKLLKGLSEGDFESPRFYRRPIASFHATVSSTSCCA